MKSLARWMTAAMAALLIVATAGCGSKEGPLMTTSQAGALAGIAAKAAGLEDDQAARINRAVADVGAMVFTKMNLDREIDLGGGVALQSVAKTGERVPDEELQLYVNLVGRTVARQSDRPNLPYTFAVLHNENPNAFAGPGGYIFITTGALALMEDESELAGVLAHEVTHVSEKHLLKMFERRRWVEAGMKIGEAIDENVTQYTEVATAGSDVLLSSGIEPTFEYQADEGGVELAAMAGYDPKGLLRFLQKMERIQQNSGGWLSTHPPTNGRIAKLDTFIESELGNAPGMRLKDRFDRRVKPHLEQLDVKVPVIGGRTVVQDQEQQRAPGSYFGKTVTPNTEEPQQKAPERTLEEDVMNLLGDN